VDLREVVTNVKGTVRAQDKVHQLAPVNKIMDLGRRKSGECFDWLGDY
jgi:hypothetical protein